jgi:hypothetical protein
MQLFLALLALLIGCVLLLMELSPYGDFMKWWDTAGF